ncbi:MAG: ribosome maturation factor RimM [Gammaproteobacteria bacterium]
MTVGRVSGLFGVKGWVKLYSFTEPRGRLLEYEPLLLGKPGGWRTVRLVEGQIHGKGLIGRFDGVEDRDQAAALVGMDLAVRRSQLPATGSDEVYWVDLLGLTVVNTRGETLGAVERLLETGANDVLVVQGDRERLIPFARGSIVKDVDLQAGTILVDWERDY